MNKRCSICDMVKPLYEFNKNKSHRDGHASECKNCNKKHRITNKEKVAERYKQYRVNNIERIYARNSKYRAAKRQVLHPTHDMKIEENLFKLAKLLREQTGEDHQVDHIFPLSSGGIHHHDNLQVIPRSINAAKKDSLTFKHPSIKHWTDLPQHVLDMIHPDKLRDAYAQCIV